MQTLANAGSRVEIEHRIASITPQSVRQWGSITVAGMLCHLTDSYQIALGERTAGHVAIAHPGLIKWVALWAPLRWPRNLKTVPELEQGGGGSAPAEFAAEQQRLLETFACFCISPTLAQHPHPMFGVMSTRDWMRWGYLHADHHLRQFGA